MKFTSIVRLQNHWWSNQCEDLKQSYRNARRALANYGNAEEKLASMVNVVEEETKLSIRHALEINQINLSTSVKSCRDDWTQPSCRTCSLAAFDAAWAGISEVLAEFTGNITYDCTHTCVESPPLAMVGSVFHKQIREYSLQVGNTFHQVGIYNLLHHHIPWASYENAAVTGCHDGIDPVPVVNLREFMTERSQSFPPTYTCQSSHDCVILQTVNKPECTPSSFEERNDNIIECYRVATYMILYAMNAFNFIM